MKSHFHIDPPLLERIVQRLSDAAGIDSASLEARRMTWTIERRCRHLHLQGPSAYLDHLESNTAELEDLIDALVIHETRFFRDPAVFEHLRTWAQGMAAVVPARALDDVAADLRTACGTLQDHHWRMHDELRSRIRFERRNLAKGSALDSEPGYHLILCRNLFIYLHAGARAILAESLSKALLPGGRLIVGAGDRVAELNARFTAVHPAAGFGFTHKPAASAVVTPHAISSAPAAHPAKKRIPTFALLTPKSADRSAPTTGVQYYCRAVEYKKRGNDRQAERRCRQALYLAPGYLPALELLQSLWHGHPNARLRRALKARIIRVRAESEAFLTAQRKAEGGTA